MWFPGQSTSAVAEPGLGVDAIAVEVEGDSNYPSAFAESDSSGYRSSSGGRPPPDVQDILSYVTDPKIDEATARQFMTEQGWPSGLQQSMIQSVARTPVRFFICDDSASMQSTDGKRLLGKGRETKLVQSTRWMEMTDAMKFHVHLAKSARCPTAFRLLNRAGSVSIGFAKNSTAAAESEKVHKLMLAFEESPMGKTPLCRNVREVISVLQPMCEQLRASNKKAVIIIMTDGEPRYANHPTTPLALPRPPPSSCYRLPLPRAEINLVRPSSI
jgi:hypothetical protein